MQRGLAPSSGARSQATGDEPTARRRLRVGGTRETLCVVPGWPVVVLLYVTQ